MMMNHHDVVDGDVFGNDEVDCALMIDDGVVDDLTEGSPPCRGR